MNRMGFKRCFYCHNHYIHSDCAKFSFGLGSAPDPDGVAYDAPQTPLVSWEGETPSPFPTVLDAFSAFGVETRCLLLTPERMVAVDAIGLSLMSRANICLAFAHLPLAFLYSRLTLHSLSFSVFHNVFFASVEDVHIVTWS